MQTVKNRKKTLSKKHALRAAQLLQKGWSSHQAGHMQEAESIYQSILNKYPNYPDAMHLSGLIAHQLGQFDLAIERFEKTLTIQPNFAEAHLNLGDCLQRLGQIEDAIKHFELALSIKPDFAEAYFNLGNSLLIQGHVERAISKFKNAVAIKPELVEVHYSLGNILKSIGSIDEAIYHFEKTVNLKPDFADAYNKLGNAYREQNKLIENYNCQRQAINLDRKNSIFWSCFAQSLEAISFSSVDENLWQDLSDLLLHPTISPKPFSNSIISAIRCLSEFSYCLEIIKSEKISIETYEEIINKLASIQILMTLMSLSSINDLEIEKMLTKLRKFMLMNLTSNKPIDLNHSLPFSSALALHCFTNEYIFEETIEETKHIEKLCFEIEKLVSEKKAIQPVLLMILATYRPLYKFPWSETLTDINWPNHVNTVIERQVKSPLSELSLRDQIPNLTNINGSVSKNVRSQYEENPYPLWVKGSLHANNMSIRDFLQASPLRFNLENYDSPENPEILVAGCGTGQHALKTASLFLNSHVLAVDLSLTSLSYALRKTKELNISNIDYAQADIMELSKIDKCFDLIESVGVLHHLENPLAGWQILTDLLKPHGVMKIGLYSEAARPDVISGRKLIKEKGYSSSAEGIRQCRQDIISMAINGDKEMEKIFSFTDFYHLSELRDLIFHVQEHRFTIPKIESHLEHLNLKFLGFELKDQNTMKQFQIKHPASDSKSSLHLWHQFETEYPDTFRGMYQFWAQKI